MSYIALIPYNMFFIALIISFLASLLGTRFIVKNATKLGWVDEPNHRTMHKKIIPTMGGIAIVISIIFNALIWMKLSYESIFIVFSALALGLIGALDDKFDLSAKIRLLIQFSLAIMAVYFFEWQGVFTELITLPPFIQNCISVLLIVGFINAFNFLDGIDGLSSSYTLISAIILASSFYSLNNYPFCILFLIITGATLGFLYFNLPPAKIFMGDSGSTVLGLLIAFGVCQLNTIVANAESTSFVNVFYKIVPIVILVIPIFDLIRTLLFRKLRGQSFLNPDKTHLHHLLIKTGLNHFKASGLIVLLYLSLFGLAYILKDQVSVLQLLFILISFSVVCTEGITVFFYFLNRSKGKVSRKYFEMNLPTDNQFLSRNL